LVWNKYKKRLSKNSIWNDSIWSLLSQIYHVISILILTSILTRLLNTNQYGIYRLAVSYFGLSQIFLLPGFKAAVVKSNITSSIYFNRKALYITFLFGIIGSLFLIIYSIFQIDKELKMMIIYAGVLLPTFSLSIYESILYGQKKISTSRRLQIIRSTLSLLVISLTAYLFHTVIAVFISYLIVNLIVNVIGYYKVRIYLKEGECNDYSQLKKYGVRQTFVSIFAIISKEFEKIILGFINPEVLAFYYIGSLIPSKIIDQSKNLLQVTTVHWGHLGEAGHKNKIINKMKCILLFVCISVVILWIAFPSIINILYGDKYNSSILIGRILLITIPISFFNYLVLRIDLVQHEGRYFRIASYISTIVKLIIIVVLVKSYQQWAVVSGVLLASFITFGFSIVLFMNYKKSINLNRL